MSGDIKPISGDYTFLGSYIFPTFNAPPSDAGTSSIVKKGDRKLTYAAYIGSTKGSFCAFTNVSGKIEHTNSGKWFEIADYGTCVFENLSGDWTIAGYLSIAQDSGGRGELYWRGGNLKHTNTDATHPFFVASGENTVAIVEKDAGDWTIANYLALAGGKGKNATASFKHNGGTMTVSGSDIRLCDKSNSTTGGATFELGGGTVSANQIKHGAGSAPATFKFDGGTLKALAAGTLVVDSDYLTVNATSNGGTIDANGKAVTIEEVIEDAPGATGAITFKGGGSMTLTADPTYTGMTTIEVGTRLAVPSPIAGNKLTFTIPAGLANGVYPVIAITGGGVFADDVLSAVTKPGDENATFRLSYDKKTIVCFYGFEAEGDVYIGATDGDLSTAANWMSGSVPTSGAPTIFCGSAATLSVGATFAPDTVIVPTSSAVVTIGAGALTVNTLTNACKLAVASGASLTVTGDYVVRDGNGTLLYSNEGTVRIGRAVCTTANDGTATTTKQYEIVTSNTQPIRTGGFLFDRVDNRLYWRLESNNTGAGAWVVGANGFAYGNIVNEKQMRYFVQNNPVTLYSSADWTLHACGQKNATSGELNVYDGNASLTIDTSDYDTPTTPHIVTLEGRIVAEKPVTIKGCGTVEVNTTGSHVQLPADLQHTCITNGTTLAVTDTATLQINAGRKITGNGTISLAAGTTLALEAGSRDEDFSTRIAPSVTLPATGAATLRIDGTRLKSGDHVIATVASGTAANVTLDLAGAALDGRKGTLRVEDGNLVLNIESAGLMLIVK